MSTDTVNIPRVWIGCLNCYNDGRLVGDWFDASEAEDVTLDDIHTAENKDDIYCEELWVFNHENLPIKGETDPKDVIPWANAYDELKDNDLWPSYCAWIDSGSHSVAADGTGDVSDFIQAYQGHYDSFREFADDFVESVGILSGVSEEVFRYFDYTSFAKDLECDYTVHDAPSGVYIYRNN